MHILVHDCSCGNIITDSLEIVTLESDPLFAVFFDERVEHIVTTPSGVPIPDNKPEKISPEQWNLLNRFYIAHLALERKIQPHDRQIFIGGVFENCVANAISYYSAFYKQHIERLFYIPDLCVSFDETEKKKTEQRMMINNCRTITINESLTLCKRV